MPHRVPPRQDRPQDARYRSKQQRHIATNRRSPNLQPTGSPGRATESADSPEQPAALATNHVSVEAFRCWVMTSVSRAAQEPDASVSLCGAKDLPAMIEVIGEAERACLAGLRALQQQAQQEYCQGDVHDGKRFMRLVARAERAAWWDGRLRWLASARFYFEKERDRSARAGAR
jgi:hypothetical protein